MEVQVDSPIHRSSTPQNLQFSRVPHNHVLHIMAPFGWRLFLVQEQSTLNNLSGVDDQQLIVEIDCNSLDLQVGRFQNQHLTLYSLYLASLVVPHLSLLFVILH